MRQTEYKRDTPEGCWKAIAIMLLVLVIIGVFSYFAIKGFGESVREAKPPGSQSQATPVWWL